MLHPILGRIPTIFFSEAVGEPPHAATGKATIDKQVGPLAQPSAADHGVDGAHMRRSVQEYGPWGSWGVRLGVFGQPAGQGT